MKSDRIRAPAVAGQFYLASAQSLKKQLELLIEGNPRKSNALACMLPHAGYQYCGKVAAATISQVNIKNKVILLGPNHTGYGTAFSIMTEGIWQTPLGEVSIDRGLAKKILENSKFLRADYLAHQYEHSLEVELPFLQYFKTDFQIIPISFLSDDLKALKEIGKEIASVIKQDGLENAVTIVASSDMTHYEPQAQAEKKDAQAIQAILELNEDKLIEKIRKFNISMCGWAPVVVMLSLVKELGAKIGKLIRYQTSGDITGDTSSVVGYAGIIIE